MQRLFLFGKYFFNAKTIDVLQTAESSLHHIHLRIFLARDRIDVYEVTGTGKNRRQQIKIHYKFVGYLELPSLARQHNYREETRKGVAVEYVPNALPA